MPRTMRYPQRMTRHFGVLIPSTNTTVEIECRLLPPTYQAHIGRLLSSGGSFSPSRDEDIDYQARLIIDVLVPARRVATAAPSLVADHYADLVTERMSTAPGVPAITSAQAGARARPARHGR